jgi:RNA polymerase sigma-70 factor (ECF subfamily)
VTVISGDAGAVPGAGVDDQGAAVVAAGAPDDPVAFGEWVRPHLRTLAHLAARLAPAADRDDLVQDALARAWAKRHLFDPDRGSAGAWLYAIAADQAAKARRRARPWVPRSHIGEPPGGPGRERDGRERDARVRDGRMRDGADRDSAERDGAARVDLARALTRLSHRQRVAVECVYFVGLSIGETAVVMGCAEGTVKSTLADARARLRPMLEVDRDD